MFKARPPQGAARRLLPLAAMLAAFCLCALAPGSANAQTRTLKLHFVHTGEKAEIVYKRNGSYVEAGLKQANKVLRDFRRNEPTKMDPRLLDLVWEVYQQTGSSGYINVISAYRSPATNGMLRSRGRGVAKNSQHTLGKAMDFFLTDVKLSKLREAGLKMGVGGVGFYPASGSPFVHLDTGNVRHWPRMSRQELARIFPDGKTLHVPSDGKPMPRYEQALAEYKTKGRTSSITVASAAKKRGFFEMLTARTQEDQADDEDGAAPEVAVASALAIAEPAPSAPAGVLAASANAPAPPPVPAGSVPVPGSEIGPAAEIATAQALLPQSIPVPQAAPRAPLGTGEQPVELAALEGEGLEDEIAPGRVPVPGRRPGLAAATSEVAAVPEPLPEVPLPDVPLSEEKIMATAALSAAEIEEMRRSAVPTRLARNPTQTATTAQPEALPQTRIAALPRKIRQPGELALIPTEPSVADAATASSAEAAERLASGETLLADASLPIGTKAGNLAPQNAALRGPSRHTLELALAATGDSSTEASLAIRDLIEAGSRRESAQAGETATAPGAIPVPQRDPRKPNAATKQIALVKPQTSAKSTQQNEKIGRHALSGGTTIGSIGEIRAPDYSMGSASGKLVAATFGDQALPLLAGKFDPGAGSRLPTLTTRTN